MLSSYNLWAWLQLTHLNAHFIDIEASRNELILHDMTHPQEVFLMWVKDLEWPELSRFCAHNLREFSV